MKLVVFVALLAFAAARSTQNGPVVVSTPDKVVVVTSTDNQRPTELLEKNTYEPYRYEQYEQKSFPSYGQKYSNIEKSYLPYQEQQYRPQGSPFEVPQYIAYELQQAHQLGLTVGQVQSYLLRQGFPQFIVQYFVEQYEAFLTQPWGKSPYLTFQYYFKQVIPQEVKEWIIQQIGQAYQHYYQYLSKDQQYVWQQEYSYPQSVSQYVTQQGKYNMQNGWSYQFLYQQLHQTFEYTEKAMQYLQSGVVPQEVYQYLFKQLQQGQQYLLNAEKVYQMYQYYPEYYVPYYASQYFFQQIQEAYQYYETAFHYIQQQQLQGTSQSYQFLFEQVRNAYHFIEIAYKTHQQNQVGQTYSGLNYYQAIRQVHLNIENVRQFIQAQVNFPQEYVQKFTEAYQIYQSLPKHFQEDNLPQQMYPVVYQQIQQANQYLFQVYEFAQHQGLHYIVEQLQYVLQVIKNLYSFYGYQNQYQHEYIGQYQPIMQQDKHYEQYYPTTNKLDVSQSWIQKYFNKNTYPTTYKYQGESQLKPYTQYYPESYQYQHEYTGQYQPIMQQDKHYEQYYPTTNQLEVSQPWIQKYFNKNTYPTTYKYQVENQLKPYTQYYPENYPTIRKEFNVLSQQDLTQKPYYPTNYIYHEQQQLKPSTQYYPENYPINHKFQEQYKSLPYTYEQNYPTYKQDYTQYLPQQYLNKNSYHPTGYPQTQYNGPYNYSNQYQYGYHGPYSSTYEYQYSKPHYTQSYKPYQYGVYSQAAAAA